MKENDGPSPSQPSLSQAAPCSNPQCTPVAGPSYGCSNSNKKCSLKRKQCPVDPVPLAPRQPNHSRHRWETGRRFVKYLNRVVHHKNKHPVKDTNKKTNGPEVDGNILSTPYADDYSMPVASSEEAQETSIDICLEAISGVLDCALQCLFGD